MSLSMPQNCGTTGSKTSEDFVATVCFALGQRSVDSESLCHFYATGFADDGDFNLAGVLQFTLNL